MAKEKSTEKTSEETAQVSEALEELGAEVIHVEETEVIDGEIVNANEALNPWESVEHGFASSELLGITSIEELEQVFADKGIEGSKGEEIATGFETPFEKSSLIDKEFIFVDWKFTQSRQIVEDEGTGEPKVEVTTFVYARLMTKDGRKGYITDGSGYGVFDQLMRISRSRAADPKPGIHPAKFLKAPDGLASRENRRGKPTYTIAHLN